MILTKPVDAKLSGTRNAVAGALLQRRYPKAAKALAARNRVYARQLEEVLKLQKDGKALVIAPDHVENMKTLSSDTTGLKKLYEKGYHDGKRILEFLS